MVEKGEGFEQMMDDPEGDEEWLRKEQPISKKKASYESIYKTLKRFKKQGLTYAEIGKLYLNVVFDSPQNYSMRGRKNIPTPDSKYIRQFFQEYMRVNLYYTLVYIGLSENIDEAIEKAIGDPRASVIKFSRRDDNCGSMEKTLFGILETNGYSDETFENIGKAILNGAEIYQQEKKKKGHNDPKYKPFVEYTRIQNSLDNLIKPCEGEDDSSFREEPTATENGGKRHVLIRYKCH